MVAKSAPVMNFGGNLAKETICNMKHSTITGMHPAAPHG
jgi:hypothetical protein